MAVSDELLDGLIDAALAAGAEIMAVYATDFAVDQKGDASPVTEADRRAETVILQRLTALLPNVPVIAEEACSGGHYPLLTGRSFVLVDPLDGTREFVARNGEFTVNIALVEGHSPVAGVVYAPALGVIYAGVVGEGAGVAEIVDGRLTDWKSAQVREIPAAGLTVLASRNHCGPETEAMLERLPVADRISAGSSLKFCRVAEGLADFYPRLGPTMEWDTAAGDAVLRAAGGRVVTLDGRDLTYGKRGVAGLNDFANPWVMAVGGFADEEMPDVA
jgi:3'(2'),5'-bisphosphate nucleotidase